MAGTDARSGAQSASPATPQPATLESVGATAPSVLETRLRSGRDGLRRRAARGTIVNAIFLVGVAVLALVQRLIIAALLTPSDFGLWAIVLLAVLAILFLKNAGIGDKFVQQDEPDQERAFQEAFTIDLLISVVCTLAAAVALPLFALAYGRVDIIVPGLVLALAIIGNSFQAPVWIFYRDLNYARQRRVQAVDPCVTFIVTIGMGVAGAGYWSLVIGAVIGAWSGGLVALRISPYRVRLRLTRATMRAYFHFSWPVVVANGSGMVVGQASQLTGTRTLGLRGAGAIGIASSFAGFADGVDGIVTQTLYPVICAVRDRADLLHEAFVKSNRLALLWGMPFGLGVALFAPDIVHFGIGEKWGFAIVLMQAFGIVAAIDQLGFNWTAFLRALDRTRPLAVLGALSVGALLAIALPLLVLFGLRGFAAGWLAWGLINLAGRMYYLKRLFPDLAISRHAARAMAPAVIAVAVVLLERAWVTLERTLGLAVGEAALYVCVVIAASVLIERPLLREVTGYLRPSPPAPGAVAR